MPSVLEPGPKHSACMGQFSGHAGHMPVFSVHGTGLGRPFLFLKILDSTVGIHFTTWTPARFYQILSDSWVSESPSVLSNRKV